MIPTSTGATTDGRKPDAESTVARAALHRALNRLERDEPNWRTWTESLAQAAAQSFADQHAIDELRSLREASYHDKQAMHRLFSAYLRGAGRLATLTLAAELGIDFPADTWAAAARFIELMMEERDWALHWRQDHRTRSDLAVADIGTRLAIVAAIAPIPLQSVLPAFRSRLDDLVLDAIDSEWLNPDSRMHSLDGMGHNYWPILIGAGGLAASLLGHEDLLQRAAEGLDQWFAFDGSALSRKIRNIGIHGDYREGFAYGQFALSEVALLDALRPDVAPLGRFLNPTQLSGMCRWLRRSFVPTENGLWPLRWGDHRLERQITASLWHRLAAASGDEQLLDMAYRIQPQPRNVADLLCWRPRGQSKSADDTPRFETGVTHYEAAGMVFIDTPTVQLTTRAGESWNHSHLDAGSFMWHQQDVLWTDDCGTCTYSLPAYRQYFTNATGHSVAYAPALCPPPSISNEEGMPHIGRVMLTGAAPNLALTVLDTNLLSGGALARSLRWFFVLDDQALIIWDDLRAYQPQSFEWRMHSRYPVQPGPMGLALQGPSKLCHVALASDAASKAVVEPATLGELSPRSLEGADLADLPTMTEGQATYLRGNRLRWTTQAVTRAKFGLAMGTTIRDAQWDMNNPEQGWTCTLTTPAASWELWFNPLADGKRMHFCPIASWGDWQTDACLLAIRDDAAQRQVYAVHGSMIRHNGRTLHRSWRREPVNVRSL